MDPVSLFNLATQQARWLSVRQAAVSNNIANANTPGYAAVDVEPFEAVLKQSNVGMRATHPMHVSTGSTPDALTYRQVSDSKPLMPSGNTVELEGELMKAGEVRRNMELNTGIVRAFHRMLLMVTKG
jgi:flagellar basal-body rod protein FlgB